MLTRGSRFDNHHIRPNAGSRGRRNSWRDHLCWRPDRTPAAHYYLDHVHKRSDQGILKVLFAALAVAGITGMYLSQVRRNGVLGLIGYLLLAAGYLSIMCTTFIGVFVMPTIVKTNPGYVKDVIALATSRGTITGDLGALNPFWSSKRFATWEAVSSSASPCSAHTFSHGGLAYSWRSVGLSAPSFRRCPTPSTDCWPFRTESR